MKGLKEFLKESKVLPASLLNVAPSSKEDRAKMHEPKMDGKDRKIPGMMAAFQNGENRDMNRRMRTGQSLASSSTQPHIGIKAAFHDVMGRGSHSKGKSISHPGTFFHGQTHAPETDEHGVVTHKAFTSWSSNPSTAMQFTKNKGQDKDTDHDAHHVFVLHHDPENSKGHSMFSLHSKEHSSARYREEEAVSPPTKYRITKTEHVGQHPETGKAVFQHTVEPHEVHPNWNSKTRGPLTPEEKHTITHGWHGFTG